jgi:hypothetical protein
VKPSTVSKIETATIEATIDGTSASTSTSSR